MAKTKPQLIQQIRFSIDQLSAKNGSMEFEKICFYFAKERIHKNILPSTGPVQSGGDQGRDFETFHSYMKNSSISKSSFVGAFSEYPVAFACSLQKNPTLKKGKIESDVLVILSSGSDVERVYFFSGHDIPVAKRHAIIQKIKDEKQLVLEVIDATALSEALSEPELLWVVEKYLDVSIDGFSDFKPKNYYEKLKAVGHNEKKIGGSLNYLSGSTAFVGRKSEYERLEKFIDSDKGFEWVIITGSGGIGKSRVGFEIGQYAYNSLNWNVVNVFEDLDYSNISLNTLIVLDDFEGSSSEVFEYLRHLQGQTLSKKVRLLIISRIFPSEEIENLKYNLEIQSPFSSIEILGLSLPKYLEIVNETFQCNGSDKKLEIKELEGFISNLDSERRPLFAILIGMAISKNLKVNEWVEKDLLDYWYHNELLKLQGQIKVKGLFEKHLNLIAVLIVSRHPYDSFIKELLNQGFRWLPELDDLNENFIYQFFRKRENCIYMECIYPDLVANYFAVKRLSVVSGGIRYGEKEVLIFFEYLRERSTKPQKINEKVTQITVREEDEPLLLSYFRFLRLSLQDFPEEEIVISINLNYAKDDKMQELLLQEISKGIIDFKVNNEAKLKGYNNLVEKLPLGEIRGIVKGHCDVRLSFIKAGFNVEVNYEFIKKVSLKAMHEPWMVNPYKFMDFESQWAEVDNYKIVAKLDLAQLDGDSKNVIWYAIPYIEALAIQVYLNKQVESAKSVILIERLKHICTVTTDPRIKEVVLSLVFNKKVIFSDNNLNSLLEKLLNIDKQVDPINVAMVVVKSYILAFKLLASQQKMTTLGFHLEKLLKHVCILKISKKEYYAIMEFMLFLYFEGNKQKEKGNFENANLFLYALNKLQVYFKNEQDMKQEFKRITLA
jgi:hypothetical protein